MRIVNSIICFFLFFLSFLSCVDSFFIGSPLRLASSSSPLTVKYHNVGIRTILIKNQLCYVTNCVCSVSKFRDENFEEHNGDERPRNNRSVILSQSQSVRNFLLPFFLSLWASSNNIFVNNVNALPQRPPESNAQAILLEAIPNPPGSSSSSSSSGSGSGLQLVKTIGLELSKMTSEGSGNIRSVDAKGQKGVKGWAEATKIYRNVESKLNQKDVQTRILKEANGGEEIYEDLKKKVANLGLEISNQDREATVANQIDALRDLDKLAVKSYEMSMSSYNENNNKNVKSDSSSIGGGGSNEYKDKYPMLNGRAEIEMVVKSKKNMNHLGTIILTLDGINAPVTSGCFFDLVEKGYYNSKNIVAVDESSVVFGNDKDSKTNFNNIPFEVKIEGEDVISYEETFEEQFKYKAKPQLPFSAYGALAMLHPNGNPNGATGSEAFFLKFDPIYTPAGLNTLDGNYAVFGYITKGAVEIDELEVNDIIESVKILDGKQYMTYPSSSSSSSN